MLRCVGMIGVAMLALVGAASAEDGFMTIHMDNQKIDSAVSLYWTSQGESCVGVPVDGFMAIHMDNQKAGSAVAAYWKAVAHPVD